MDLSQKSVLVTGADGFIGSHLVEALRGKCGSLTALCCYNSFNSYGNFDDLAGDLMSGLPGGLNSVNFISGDVRDPFFCADMCKHIDVVFNLAALIAIPYSYIAPQSYIETNVTGALNICQAALHGGASRVIQLSTSEVYGTAEYVPIDEKHPLKPQSPYSASKIGADSIAMSFYNAFGLPVTIARPFNVYGPRQSARAVIPTIITQIAAGMTSIKLGDLSPTRDFTYVKDTCRGLILLAACDEAVGQVVNIGSNFEISIFDTVMKIKELMGSAIEIVQEDARKRPKGSEVFRLWCDNSKIERLTGFKPGFTIDEGLGETINWFSKKDNLSRYKEGIYNV